MPAGGRARSGVARRALTLGAMAAGLGVVGAGAASADPGTADLDSVDFAVDSSMWVPQFHPDTLSAGFDDVFSLTEDAAVADLFEQDALGVDQVQTSPWDGGASTGDELLSPEELLGDDWEPFGFGVDPEGAITIPGIGPDIPPLQDTYYYWD